MRTSLFFVFSVWNIIPLHPPPPQHPPCLSPNFSVIVRGTVISCEGTAIGAAQECAAINVIVRERKTGRGAVIGAAQECAAINIIVRERRKTL